MLRPEQQFLINHFRLRMIALGVIAGCGLAAAAQGATVALLPQHAARSVACEAHVREEGVEEQVAPCGTMIRMSGKHAVGWIETPTEITPFLTDVTAGGEIEIPRLAPSGVVDLTKWASLGPGQGIRLVSLQPQEASSSLRPLFQRDVSSRDAKPRMPAGRAIALLIDRSGTAVAVSGPMAISPAAETAAWPTRPEKNGSVLVAWLKRSGAAESIDRDRVKIAVVDSRGSHAPDAMVNASDSVFAVWYTLTEMKDRLTIDSHYWRLERDLVSLAPAAVTMVQETLQLLPTLTVAISPLPTRVMPPDSPMRLTAASVVDETKLIRSLPVEPGKTYTLDSVPASILTLRLRVGDFIIERQADLTSGADANVSIQLEPIIVSGTVSLGDEPTRAQVRFQQRSGALLVQTDDRGYYEMTLWQKRRYIVETTLTERPDMPPFAQNLAISATQTLDIHLPLNVLSAHVYDAESGKPIDGARIAILNRWIDDVGPHSAASTVISRTELTMLPPQRVGTSEISVQADGYSQFPSMSLTIDENLRNRTLDVPLKKVSGGIHVQINLEGNTPAAGAEMAAWTVAGDIEWLGTVDDSGQIAVPPWLGGQRLLVRHPAGASVVVLFGSDEPVTILLTSPAPSLVVQVVHRDQSRIGTAAALLTVWCGAVRLSGAIAGFATWSMGATSGDALWIGKGLPREAARVLFTRSLPAQQLASGSLDGLATTIPYPWPSVVSVALAAE
jgi:hypothetical protein